MMKKGRGRTAAMIGIIGLLALAQPSGAMAQPMQPALKNYANCTALNKVYHHGVGMKGAHDHVSGGGAPVTNFYRNNALYKVNKGKDRDGDKIACEKH